MMVKKKTTTKTKTNLLKELNLFKNFTHRSGLSSSERRLGLLEEWKPIDGEDKVGAARVSGGRPLTFESFLRAKTC
jgi:hypothetical protein